MTLDLRTVALLTGLFALGLVGGVTVADAQGWDADSGDACKVLPTEYSLSDTAVEVGEPITIEVVVENTCDREETTDVVPMKDGQHVRSKSKTVSVPANSQITVTVDVSFSTAGTHTVSIFPLDNRTVEVGTNQDSDGDGVPDGEDQCPNDPEDEDGVQDSDGCPDDPIWTLSLLTEEQRNDECVQRAIELAQKIALSEEAADAWEKVNKPDLDVSEELAPGQGPEIKFEDLGKNVLGLYKGESDPPQEGRIFIDERFFENCDESDETFVTLVSTILHETAHWKEDVKKFPSDEPDSGEPKESQGIEEGEVFIDDTFGKQPKYTDDADDFDRWKDPTTWTDEDDEVKGVVPIDPSGMRTEAATDSDLALTVEPTKEAYDPDDPVRVDVRVTNTGNASVEVLTFTALEHHPYYFEVNEADGDYVSFVGPEVSVRVTDSDFVTLAPGESHTETVAIAADPDSGTARYNITETGDHAVTAVYNFGDRTVQSNATTITIAEGGPVERADANDDGEISTSELQSAIREWAVGDISTSDLQAVIRAWAVDG